MDLLRQSRAAVVTCLSFFVCASTLVEAGEPLQIDLSGPSYEFEGWGTSLCWWAHRLGDWPDEKLDPLIGAIADPEAGLGLSVFRYNIGGGANPTLDRLRPGGDVPGFKAGPDEPIDPDADPNQRRVLQKLLERAEEPIVEAFSNSPPYWMTRSGYASGAEEGGPNLPDDRIDDFAAYLADVVRLYRDHYGIVFRTIDPFNEPNESWWVAGGRQEGCHIPESQQPAVIEAMASALADRGLAPQTRIAATDAHSIDTTLRNVRALSVDTLAKVGQINTHTYRGSMRTELRQFAAANGKRLWQSESGPMGLDARGRGAATAMMARVVLDLNELRPAAWVMWQVIDDGSIWSCFKVDFERQTFKPTSNFRLYRPLTCHIRPGDRIVPTDDPKVIASLAGDASRASVVVINDKAKAQRRSIRLDGLELSEALPRVMCGQSDSKEAVVEGLVYRDQLLSLTVPPRSVTAITW